MNVWLDSLQTLLEKEVLAEFDEIYYLGSTKIFEIAAIDKTIIDQNLKEFLRKNDTDVNEDLLDFFLLVNDERQDVLVVFSPIELFENEKIFHLSKDLSEDFSDLESIELVKG
ncbi:hypothetical protein [Moheibacter lacus]|uniref:Uncharacterized protein n=1 Tax=Moheibacter lacus TaxID=2745851 RepID=A0A838ZPL3_9FLAO|nr:hypothetical protein [Moheibacter lacus]MBA5629427.1 hypothetical protein [Moheibacter lacus]